MSVPPAPARVPPPAGLAAGWAGRLVRLAASRMVSLVLVGAVTAADALPGWQRLGFVPRALVDEPCHLATALIVLGALARWRGRPPSGYFVWAMLAASVLIDVDHLPLEFGSTVWTAGTPRPYTHALWVVAVLAGVAAVSGIRARVPGRARAATVAAIFAGAAWGVAAHFLRDVATAPIALWWPLSSAGTQIPQFWYLLALIVLAVVPVPARRGRAGRLEVGAEQGQVGG